MKPIVTLDGYTSLDDIIKSLDEYINSEEKQQKQPE